MSDEEGGAFSPRLARITGGEDLRRAYKWRNWWKRNRRRPLDAARVLPALPSEDEPDRTLPTPSPENEWSEVATMELADFSKLADHLERLAHQPVDLAIVIDCTASMSGEIADAQGGVDDLMRFVGDVSGGIRVGIVGYRDRREKFETVGWDFTSSIDDARANLWRLSAEGGGDKPELVDEGLELAVTKFHWNQAHRGVLVLVGDAPPHPGRGAACVTLAAHARRHGVTDQLGPDGIRGAGRRSFRRDRASIGFFPEIAAAGGGRVVNLARDERLVPEIAGLIVGTEFEAPMVEFFEVYMTLK
jgi:Mg-chelatase subunit ChlD